MNVERRAETRIVTFPAVLQPVLSLLAEMAEREGIPVYAVGGFVRDALLGRRNVDVDVVVERDGLGFSERFSRTVGGRLTTHPQFQTATIRLPRRARGLRLRRPLRVDVATCRTERYATPAAYPTISAGTLQEDLFRRDVTINAIVARLTGATPGELIDCCGGLADLRQGIIRILHDRSFEDDPSRILRAIRFEQRLRFTIEPRTLAALQAALRRGNLQRLNAGRLAKELAAMTQERRARACLARLSQLLRAALEAP